MDYMEKNVEKLVKRVTSMSAELEYLRRRNELLHSGSRRVRPRELRGLRAIETVDQFVKRADECLDFLANLTEAPGTFAELVMNRGAFAKMKQLEDRSKAALTRFQAARRPGRQSDVGTGVVALAFVGLSFL